MTGNLADDAAAKDRVGVCSAKGADWPGFIFLLGGCAATAAMTAMAATVGVNLLLLLLAGPPTVAYKL